MSITLYRLQRTCFYFLKDFINLFLERGERREKERQRNTDMREKHRLVVSHTCLDQGSNPKPKYVP